MSLREEWAPVAGWPGYEVSSVGSVRSFKRGRRGGLITAFQDADRYLRVNLCDGPRRCQVAVHRLVALAFVHGDGEVVRHLDGDPTNNSAANLAWGTYEENEEDKRRHGRVTCGERHHSAKLTAEIIKDIRTSGATGKALARKYGVSEKTVSSIRRRETWGHVC